MSTGSNGQSLPTPGVVDFTLDDNVVPYENPEDAQRSIMHMLEGRTLEEQARLVFEALRLVRRNYRTPTANVCFVVAPEPAIEREVTLEDLFRGITE